MIISSPATTRSRQLSSRAHDRSQQSGIAGPSAGHQVPQPPPNTSEQQLTSNFLRPTLKTLIVTPKPSASTYRVHSWKKFPRPQEPQSQSQAALVGSASTIRAAAATPATLISPPPPSPASSPPLTVTPPPFTVTPPPFTVTPPPYTFVPPPLTVTPPTFTFSPPPPGSPKDTLYVAPFTLTPPP